MTAKLLICICLFFGLAQQFNGTNANIDKEEGIVEHSAIDDTFNGQKTHTEFFDVPQHFDNGGSSVSDGISEFFEANEQFAESNEEMKKNVKAIAEMVISPKFSKIVGQKEKHIKSQTQKDEQNDENEKMKQHIASSSNSVDKCDEENIKNYIKKIHGIISSKVLNIFKRDFMECPICYEFVMYDQLCFCDHLMGDTIFGSSSNNAQKELHIFCHECLKSYTKAALETKSFARGWLGLKCMAEKCENPIPWQEIKAALPREFKSIQALENQCAEFSVAAAGLCLERCPKCNCAIDMDAPLPFAGNETNNTLFKLSKSEEKAIKPYEKLKFHCPECHFEKCRKCNAKWAEEHTNLTCEQFAKQQKREQNQLSEALIRKIRKCPTCKSPIEKNGDAVIAQRASFLE